MRDPVKTAPGDTAYDPMRGSAKDPKNKSKGMSRWIWIGGLVLLALILVMWFAGGMDTTEEVAVEPAASIPADAVIVEPEAGAVALQPGTEADTVPSTPPE